MINHQSWPRHQPQALGKLCPIQFSTNHNLQSTFKNVFIKQRVAQDRAAGSAGLVQLKKHMLE